LFVSSPVGFEEIQSALCPPVFKIRHPLHAWKVVDSAVKFLGLGNRPVHACSALLLYVSSVNPPIDNLRILVRGAVSVKAVPNADEVFSKALKI